ncbi:MAG: alpha/beta fold hydrolase [archaeon]
MTSPLFITNMHHEQLAAVLEGEQLPKKALVIICHGFGAHKNLPWKQALSATLLQRKLPSLRFDFSGCGESQGLFEESTYTKQLSDLFSVINWSFEHGYHQLYLAGHSRAGSVVLRAASERHGICGVIDIAGVAYVEQFDRRLTAAQARELQLTGKTAIPLPIRLDGKLFTLTKEFIDDTKTWHLFQTVKHIKCPLLIIHGEKDQSVPLQDSKDLYWEAMCEKVMDVLPGCDHYFRSEQEQQLLAITITRWVMKHENATF